MPAHICSHRRKWRRSCVLRPLLLLGNVGTEREHCGTGWGALSSERWGPWECVLQWKWYWVPGPACRVILAQGVKLDLPFGVSPMPATQLPLFQEHQSCLSELGKLGKKPCRGFLGTILVNLPLLPLGPASLKPVLSPVKSDGCELSSWAATQYT